MLAVRLHGPKDLRVEEIQRPSVLKSDEVLIRVTAVGICGSDLHNYEDARIGDTEITSPVVLGHEFAGVVETTGVSATDGNQQPLVEGQRVAVDPATPCYECEQCELGNPHLCSNLHFHGLFPDDGALQEYVVTSGRGCFPLSDDLTDAEGALLEPLGVAIHAIDLGQLRVADSVAVVGCGPIGLLLIRLARLSGADPIYAFDKFKWRANKAEEWGANQAWTLDDDDPVEMIEQATHGRGVDVAFEAAWADHSINMAAQMTRSGGRLVLVGIPSENVLKMDHSMARRKALTILMSRRMKHTYPRAIHLATKHQHAIELKDLISHRFPLEKTPEAFAMNLAYQKNVLKVVIKN